MENSGNVKISAALFQDTLYLLSCLQPILLTDDVHRLYKNVYRELQRKQYNIELRDTYASVINAKTEEDREKARARYLAEKRGAEEFLKIFE
jgi:hypothetical protein